MTSKKCRCLEAFLLIFVALMPTVFAILALEFNFWSINSNIMIGLVLFNLVGASVLLIILERRNRRQEENSSTNNDSEYEYQEAETSDEPPNYDEVIANVPPPYESIVISGCEKVPLPSYPPSDLVSSPITNTNVAVDIDPPSYQDACLKT